MESEYVISKNLKQLYGRITAALQTDAVENVRRQLSNLPDRVLTVGTGGSYAAALFAAKCINTFEKSIAISIKPRDALLCPLEKFGLVLLFSYSGTTNDIQVVYSACRAKGVPVCVITALDPAVNSCPFERKDIISYAVDSPDFEEHGFISMASTLIPMCLFGNHYYKGVDSFEHYLETVFFENEKDFGTPLMAAPKTSLTIDVFTAYDTETASTILESDITESGIGRVTVHEKKDFSHGRYNAIEGMTPDWIVFLNNKVGSYTGALNLYLSERMHTASIELTTEYEGIWGDFDLAVSIQFLMTELSEQMGYDMSNPVYPEEAKALYKYANEDLF